MTLKKTPYDLWSGYVFMCMAEMGHGAPEPMEDRGGLGDSEKNLLKVIAGYEFEGIEFTVERHFDEDCFNALGTVHSLDEMDNSFVSAEEIFIGFEDDSMFQIYIPKGKPPKIINVDPTGIAISPEFSMYKKGQECDLMEFLPKVFAYLKGKVRNVKEGSPEQLVEPFKADVPVHRPVRESSPNDHRLDEILRVVKSIRHGQAEHPMSLKDDETYLKDLYTRTINEDRDNLKFFEYNGERIPYVLVHSSDLEGKPGRVTKKLYFVARDFAPEEWQQQIVAYHESLCSVRGHDKAVKAEPALAEHLGKLEEYKDWRTIIDNRDL